MAAMCPDLKIARFTVSPSDGPSLLGSQRRRCNITGLFGNVIYHLKYSLVVITIVVDDEIENAFGE